MSKKDNFSAKTDENNKNKTVSKSIENNVKKQNTGIYIDDLWNRIGTKLQKQNIQQDDIEPVIQQIRTEKSS